MIPALLITISAILFAISIIVQRKLSRLSRFRNNLTPGQTVSIRRNAETHTATIRAIYTGGTCFTQFENGTFNYVSFLEIYPLNS